MIIQELKKEPPSFSLIETLKNKYLPSVVAPSGNTSPPTSLFAWSKLEYSRWIEGVKKEFKVGDFVCLKQVPYVVNRTPFYYRVAFIQEIHYEVQMDFTKKIPKAIGLVIPGTVTPTWRTPDELRHLNQEELTHVNNGTTEEFPQREDGIPVNTTS